MVRNRQRKSCGNYHIFTLDIIVFFYSFIHFFFLIRNERVFVQRKTHVKKFESELVLRIIEFKKDCCFMNKKKIYKSFVEFICS